MTEFFTPAVIWLILGGYFLLINLIAYGSMGLDKHLAIKGKSRVPEKRHYLFALMGGAGGIMLGLKSFRHKTLNTTYRFMMPFIGFINLILYVAAIYMLRTYNLI